MILFPAIDLKDGQCVRLKLGDMDQATVFNEDPAAQARDFADQGFEWLHLVDLNGAFAGRPVNAGAVDAILAATTVPDELEVSATTADGEVMGVRHREHPVDGVQFHPESVLTPLGPTLAKNFLEAG